MNPIEDFNLDDLPEELKGDIVPEIDPEKLFDEKEYATLIIGNEDGSKKDILNADLITVLISEKTSREEKDEALVLLKTNQAKDMLLKAISKTKNAKQKATIIAACWETGLDFSKEYLTFIELICSSDFNVSFEAFTVITEMENEVDKETLMKAITILKPHCEKNNLAKELTDMITTNINAL
jgi:GH24 family phage-related lysozyme (muramidase)